MNRGVVFVLTLLTAICIYGEAKITIQTKPLLEIGSGGLMFQNIGSVCEDEKGNFYVLDHKSHKIKKFSADGKKLLDFGRKGQGDGEISRPHLVTISQAGQVVVPERIDVVNFFDTDGRFLDKINFSATVGFVFFCDSAGSDLFYAEKRLMDGALQQVIFNADGDIVREDLYQIPPPGVLVENRSYLAINEIYSPFLLFNRYDNIAAAAVSNRYEITLLDDKGNVIRKITRKTSPFKISPAEKNQFVADLKETPFPPGVGSEIIRQLPKYKNLFHKLAITRNHVFAFRIKTDILDKNAPVPVDVFSLNGNFLGTAYVESLPVYVSQRFIYTKKRNKAGELLLVKQSYTLK